MKKLLWLPYTFVLMNLALLAGLYHFITGKRDVWLENKLVHRHRD
jgi:hypothetical protein